MRLPSLMVLIMAIYFFVSCGNQKKSDKANYSIKVSKASKKIQSGDSLRLSIKSKIDNSIDSISYFYNDKFINKSLKNKSVSVQLRSPLGRHVLKANIYKNGKKTAIEKDIVLHAQKKPKIYTYKIKNAFPHDSKAFTQGLEFYNDTLYEGTGEYGVSELRKVDFKTGKILKRIKLDRKYFGEGITIMDGKIYQLTWRESIGFVYDLNSFEKLKTFEYDKSKEGWGLCNDGKVLYKSDGSNKIWTLDPNDFKETHYIEPVTHSSLATRVNELEWIDGKIYANTWQKDGVLIINPGTGAVEGVIDFRGLKDELDNTNKANVLNGIAYNKNTKRLYVTGKKWDKLFEVEIVEK